MKKSLCFFIAAILVIQVMALISATAQNYFADTVWVRSTDQADGFYMVKFSNTDKYIVGLGYTSDLFFDTKTGQEIKRILGNKEVFFIENDTKFVRVKKDRSKIEIFDINTWQSIDTLENDGKTIYEISAISLDKRFFISTIQGGYRIWDLNTKKILRTRVLTPEEYLTKFNIEHIEIFNDNSKFIVSEYKEYTNPSLPGPNKSWSTEYHKVYDFNTMDSIDAYQNFAYFQLSNDCSKIAFKTGDPDYGVEVYDFNTKALIWRIPINGPSLTGLEFDSTDRYLVTAPTITIWDINKISKAYGYQSGTANTLALSKDNKNILSSTGNYLILWKARYEGTSVPEEPNPTQIIYPNPTTGTISISFEQKFSEITKISIKDINGKKIKELLNKFLPDGQQNLSFNVIDLSQGTYFITVENTHLSLTFKFIVNK